MSSSISVEAWQWVTADNTHVIGAAAVGVAVVTLVAYSTGRVRRHIAAARARREAGGAEGMDPFTVYVTLMATALSVNGMWHVFTETIPLPGVVRVIASSVLESTGFAFMRNARTRILAKKPATRDIAAVWAIALLSGSLSAVASHSALEAVIRFVLPSLAVRLCHSWMLPEHDEITLTQHEKGKRAWRFVKARRRLDRAGNPLTRRLARALVNLETDRLTKRSLMSGDAAAVLAAAERAATIEALSGLGANVRPATPKTTKTDASDATDADVSDVVKTTASKTSSSRTRRAPVKPAGVRSDGAATQAAVADLLSANPEMSTKDMAAVLELSPRQVQRHVATLTAASA